MENSFIKLYRSLLDWEWWDDKNVTRLFLTILLSANWQTKKWHGMTIEKGSVFTSTEHLSKKSGLTMQQTRTALNKLKSTGEITIKSTNKGTLVKVENWGKYQFMPEEITNDQQQLKKEKNKKNINNIKNVGEPYRDSTGRIRFNTGR